MKIAFVNPKNEMPKLKYTRKVQRQYSDRGQVFPDLSICYLASLLEKLGHSVKIVESNALARERHDAPRPDAAQISYDSPRTNNFVMLSHQRKIGESPVKALTLNG